MKRRRCSDCGVRIYNDKHMERHLKLSKKHKAAMETEQALRHLESFGKDGYQILKVLSGFKGSLQSAEIGRRCDGKAHTWATPRLKKLIEGGLVEDLTRKPKEYLITEAGRELLALSNQWELSVR